MPAKTSKSVADHIVDLESRLREKHAELTDLQATRHRRGETIISLNARIQGLEAERDEAVAALNREKSATKETIAMAQRALDGLRAERDQLAEDLDNANMRLMDVETALVNITVRLA